MLHVTHRAPVLRYKSLAQLRKAIEQRSENYWVDTDTGKRVPNPNKQPKPSGKRSKKPADSGNKPVPQSYNTGGEEPSSSSTSGGKKVGKPKAPKVAKKPTPIPKDKFKSRIREAASVLNNGLFAGSGMLTTHLSPDSSSGVIKGVLSGDSDTAPPEVVRDYLLDLGFDDAIVSSVKMPNGEVRCRAEVPTGRKGAFGSLRQEDVDLAAYADGLTASRNHPHYTEGQIALQYNHIRRHLSDSSDVFANSSHRRPVSGVQALVVRTYDEGTPDEDIIRYLRDEVKRRGLSKGEVIVAKVADWAAGSTFVIMHPTQPYQYRHRDY